MKVHLVDGTFELFRGYFGPPSRKNAQGEEIGATRSVVRSLSKMLRDDNVTHMGVAFDTTVECFRNDLFDGYKTGEGMDPELYAQFVVVEEAVRSMGIVVWSMIEFEADDGIASATERYKSEAEQVVICSPDKDLYQMLEGDNVISWDAIRKKNWSEKSVFEKLGVTPKSVPDYLALVGDPADGIPGLERWGAKSASTMLAHYGTIENIPNEEMNWEVKPRGAKTLAAVLAEQRDDAMLYKKLATLRTDVAISQPLSALEWKEPTPHFEKMLQRLELTKEMLF